MSTIKVRYVFDSIKDASNIAKHQGVSLADAELFEWDTSVIREDTRKPYPEARFEAMGYLGVRLHVMVYCHRGDAIRVISLRKANQREEFRYAKT